MPWSVWKDALRSMGGEHLLERFAPPAEAEALLMVEEQLGAPLPASVRRHLLEHDGAPDLLPGPMLIGTRTMPLVHREVVELGELEDVDLSHLVPVAWDEQAPYICVDPSADDRVVEVEETAEVEELAPSLDAWLEGLAARLAGDDRDYCVSRAGVHWLEGWDYYRVESGDDAEVEVISARGPKARLLPSTRFHGDEVPRPADVIVAETYHAHSDRAVAFAYVHQPAEELLAALEPALARWREAGFPLPEASRAMLLAVPYRGDDWRPDEVAAHAFAAAHPVLQAAWRPVRVAGAVEALGAFARAHGVPLPMLDAQALAAEARRVGAASHTGPGAWLATTVLAQVNGALAAAGDERRFGRVTTEGHALADAWLLVTEGQRRSLEAKALVDLAFAD